MQNQQLPISLEEKLKEMIKAPADWISLLAVRTIPVCKITCDDADREVHIFLETSLIQGDGRFTNLVHYQIWITNVGCSAPFMQVHEAGEREIPFRAADLETAIAMAWVLATSVSTTPPVPLDLKQEELGFFDDKLLDQTKLDDVVLAKDNHLNNLNQRIMAYIMWLQMQQEG